MKETILIKKTGELLIDAGIVNSNQVLVALWEQKNYPELRIGEILAYHGWITQKTADFFGEKIKGYLSSCLPGKTLEEYLLEAGILHENQIEEIRDEKTTNTSNFATVALEKGYIKPKTIDFFKKYLNALEYPDLKPDSPKVIHNHENSSIEEIELTWLDC
ncbi:MAG: hypothetical protein NZ901_00965 [Geminocystis sp.]|nr:hypothetical protein [Geminocystis sp.]HIK36515.1 hypothetical protein [Geminocystis sp. M7585_C2015_104]MCS7146740.1 hypothetical protein [Geminocystis sp.]MCX8077110.1 hypothetical protein [Geminocystis sp.]MDW8115566.1 hypothetical protein [Geminocystis sp.]